MAVSTNLTMDERTLMAIREEQAKYKAEAERAMMAGDAPTPSLMVALAHSNELAEVTIKHVCDLAERLVPILREVNEPGGELAMPAINASSEVMRRIGALNTRLMEIDTRIAQIVSRLEL